MGLEKAIKHGKERRRPYSDSRRFDYSCRHGGSCPWCRDGRLVRRKRTAAAARVEEQAAEGDTDA